MKKILFLSVLFLYFNYCYGQVWNLRKDANTERAQLYFSKFISKPVYELLLDDSVRGYEKMRFTEEPPGKLSSVRIRQNKYQWFDIIICKYAYLKRENFDRNWDKNLFYKEEVCRLLFYKNDTIYLDVKDTTGR